MWATKVPTAASHRPPDAPSRVLTGVTGEDCRVRAGSPLHVDKPPVEQPSQEQVDRLHAQLLQAIEALFDRHKHALGWGHKKIRFV